MKQQPFVNGFPTTFHELFEQAKTEYGNYRERHLTLRQSGKHDARMSIAVCLGLGRKILYFISEKFDNPFIIKPLPITFLSAPIVQMQKRRSLGGKSYEKIFELVQFSEEAYSHGIPSEVTFKNHTVSSYEAIALGHAFSAFVHATMRIEEFVEYYVRDMEEIPKTWECCFECGKSNTWRLDVNFHQKMQIEQKSDALS
jgi:hypothetical protein